MRQATFPLYATSKSNPPLAYISKLRACVSTLECEWVTLLKEHAEKTHLPISYADILFTQDSERLIENGYTLLKRSVKETISYHLPRRGTRTHVAQPTIVKCKIIRKVSRIKYDLGDINF